jgi:hypothetical protein
MMCEAHAPPFSPNSQIRLHPLSKQIENGVAIIGRGDQFLELPPEGLDFVAWLAEGLSITQARERFEARYNPFPDAEVIEVMDAFLDCGFIAAIDGQAIAPRRAPLKSSAEWIPQKWARALFSKPILIAWIAFVVPAFAFLLFTPELWPRRSDYFWSDYNFVVVLSGLLLWLVGMSLHELVHFLAARAKGIEASITWTQRLGFFPMSQTIMHNIWAIPRPARLLPIGAGMAWDVLGMSVVLYVLLFHRIGTLSLPLVVVRFLKFYLLTFAMALVSQFWLFSKMDGYFLLSALLGQRNLQSDTYGWLKSKLSRSSEFDVPAGGMKFIYIYAAATLIWGGLFMGQFLIIDLPIKLRLLWESVLKISGGVDLARVDFADGVAVLTSQGTYWGLLVYAYLRDTLPNWRRA